MKGYFPFLLKTERLFRWKKHLAGTPDLDSLNIGGGFPIKNSLDFSYDYEYLTEEIIAQIKNCLLYTSNRKPGRKTFDKTHDAPLICEPPPTKFPGSGTPYNTRKR